MAQPLFHTAHIEVRPEGAEAFLARLRGHAAVSRREPGCLRFDVYRDRAEPARFCLFEAYLDQEALEDHRASPHFAAFREAVDPWVLSRTWWFWEALDLGEAVESR